MTKQIELKIPTETESVETCRAALIVLRDHSLKQGDMSWAVRLSHCIAWMSALQDAGVE